MTKNAGAFLVILRTVLYFVTDKKFYIAFTYVSTQQTSAKVTPHIENCIYGVKQHFQSLLQKLALPAYRSAGVDTI